MTDNERLNLQLELERLNNLINSGDLVDPKVHRKRDEINAKLYGQWKLGKPRESNRVTSFTKDRR